MTGKCPKCGAVVDHLDNFAKVWERWSYEGDGDYSCSEIVDCESSDNEYCCPECRETLTYSEDIADKILKGEDITQ